MLRVSRETLSKAYELMSRSEGEILFATGKDGYPGSERDILLSTEMINQDKQDDEGSQRIGNSG